MLANAMYMGTARTSTQVHRLHSIDQSWQQGGPEQNQGFVPHFICRSIFDVIFSFPKPED